MSAKSSEEILILPITQGSAQFCIVGSSPFIFNRMSEKAKRTLLLGGGRKTAADKAANLKHDPIAEYRASVYRNPGNDPATRLCLPAPALKGAMKTAALDIPGAKKTEIGRLVWVEGYTVDLYGAPKLFMSVVRSADMAKTPDIRTRAIVPQWAARVTINFVQPKLNAKSIATLLGAGGILAGVGDHRQEKGSGSYGQFRICDDADPDFRRVIAEGGRAAQDEALERCECFDDETRELLEFYSAEVIRLGRDSQSTSRKPRKEAA